MALWPLSNIFSAYLSKKKKKLHQKSLQGIIIPTMTIKGRLMPGGSGMYSEYIFDAKLDSLWGAFDATSDPPLLLCSM